uniref:WD_REPEATS_REGION domain-containing protein n=1 Tax=Glossina brevipalpis TaxID=37001 RepID=A0A1A9WZE3_9MUSC
MSKKENIKVNVKKSKNKRYFEDTADENVSKKIKVKSNKRKDFEGEIIKVEQNVQKPLKVKKHFKRFRPQLDKRPKLPKEILKKYTRGEQVESSGVKTKYFKQKLQRKEIYLEYATEQAARTEIQLSEQQGFIEPGEEEITAEYRQADIVKNVDIQSAAKHFKLNLDFGPYCMRYSKNGRHLLLGGRKGHVAAFDWVTKKLHCEMNVMEEVADVSFFHVHTMFACAQKDHVYVYDNQGTELHCVKRMYRVNKMEFLPYHFLLATGNNDGYVSWLDVSIGELVGNFNTNMGGIRMMRHNPANGVLCTGGGKGVVSMWSPKIKEPLAKLLCHATPTSALAVDHKGQHLITAGLDSFVKIWDIRALSGPLAQYKLSLPANQLEVSQKGVLAISQGNYCEMYNNFLMAKKPSHPYLKHYSDSFVHSMRFCPYEDILGIATANSFQSLLVPGSGEPNYDALEDNPYETKKQRREHEVHALLEKIPSELITLDPNEITTVDVPTLQEKVDAKKALFFIKPPQVEINPRRKMKGRGGSVKAARNKQIVKDMKRKEFIANVRQAKQNIIATHKEKEGNDDFIPLVKPTSVLDRFKPKKTKT